MASLVEEAEFAGRRRLALDLPTLLFVGASVVILGACAFHAARGHWLNQPNRDIYQHLAALRALIADIHHPTNPFIVSSESSRHFHPYWVFMAWLARMFGWSPWQALGAAAFLNAIFLASGFYCFGRTYYRSTWGPLVLMLCAVFAWSIPISHTGYINQPTLVEGLAYPAVFLMALSLLLWALIIKALARPALAALAVPLVALMFATHQLGAGLGLIVATVLALTWPNVALVRRVLILVTFALGLLVSTAWPYFNPVEAVIKAGNPTWTGGLAFYTPYYLGGIFVPSAVGIAGLIRPVVPGTGRPLLIALLIMLVGFASGAFGILIGTRFAPVAALILQIGLAAILIKFIENPSAYGDKFRLALAGGVFGTILFQVLALGLYLYPREHRDEVRYGNVYETAQSLTKDIPDDTPVAAYDVTAWPIAALGQKVYSIPWPEPFISDLTERQRVNDLLFDPRLTADQRRYLARSVGVRSLLLDVRYGPGRHWMKRETDIFTTQSKSAVRYRSFIRFDLF